MTFLPKDQTEQAMDGKTKTVRELVAVDISSLQQDILNLSQETWKAQDEAKPNKFEKLGRTEHIVFQFVRDYDNHLDVVDYPIWQEWKDKIKPILETVVEPYGYKQGGFSRIMLAKLPPGGKINLHIDPYQSSNFTHKIHIPIQTNPDVEFWVGRKRYYFLEGHGYEVNNKALHGGINRGSTDRINLIFEYYEK